MLRACGLGLLRGTRKVLDEVDLRLDAGRMLAVLGPNGAGKSSLLRVLSGEWPPSTGQVRFMDRPLAQWSSLALARQRALLAQTESLRFGFRVEEVVAMGRLPWTGQPPVAVEHICAQALTMAGVADLHGRIYTELSAGERARVQLARVVAQIWDAPAPRLLLLDEPTASLDLAHQHQVLTALKGLARLGVGIVLVLHDLNLALRYVDEALLLAGGRVHSQGPVDEVLTPPNIEAVYGIAVDRLQHAGDPHGWIAPRPRGGPF